MSYGSDDWYQSKVCEGIQRGEDLRFAATAVVDEAIKVGSAKASQAGEIAMNWADRADGHFSHAATLRPSRDRDAENVLLNGEGALKRGFEALADATRLIS